jgi:hypothetical protein
VWFAASPCDPNTATDNEIAMMKRAYYQARQRCLARASTEEATIAEIDPVKCSSKDRDKYLEGKAAAQAARDLAAVMDMLMRSADYLAPPKKGEVRV